MAGRPHRTLIAWQEAMGLAEASYRFTEQFPARERWGLASQIRRAATSVPANIAEGAARQSHRETVQFYFIARASLSELDTLIELSRRVGLLQMEDHAALMSHAERVSALLQGLMMQVKRTQALPQSPSHLVT